MNLLMISGDRAAVQAKHGAFHYTLTELTKHFERIDIITPRVADPQPSPFPNVTFHPSPRGLWYQPRWIAKRGMQLIAAHGHRAMAVHEFPPFYNGLGARRLHRKTGVPYALEIHHITGYPLPASHTERVGYAMSRVYLKRDARKAAAVRVVNEEVCRVLESWGIPREKIALVPSFYLDAEILQPDSPAAKTHDIVFAGRMVANKGLPDVIAAMTELPGKRLLVIGDGPLRSTATQLARRLGVADRITFLGWLRTQEDVLRAMRSARIFVMNSRSEGGPRVALEAMALGLPVVVTKVGVMPEVVREGVNGMFTDGTAADLAKTFARLLGDDQLRERMGNEARRIIDTFERGEAVKRYADFLKSLA